MRDAISVRVSTADDLPALERFYSGELGRVEPRQHADFAQSVARGGAHLVIKFGELVGCSMAYSLCNAAYVEIGSTLIRGLRGLPIYELLISLQLLHEFSFRPPARMAVANIDLDQQGLIGRVVRAGWRPYTPPAELVSANVQTVALRSKAVTWFRFPATALPEHAQRIDQVLKLRALRTVRGEAHAIDLSELRLVAQSADLLSCLAAMRDTSAWSEDRWSEARASLALRL